MTTTNNDLSASAAQVLDRAALAGRGLVETGHGLLDTAGGLVGSTGALAAVAGALVNEVAETLVQEAGELAAEAGERAARLGETVSEVATEHVAPVVRSTTRTLRANNVLLILLALSLVGLVYAVRRRRADRRRDATLSAVSSVQQPEPEPVPTI